MKNKRRWLILEGVLAILVILVAVAMLREKNGKEQGKISVIVENSDDYQWSAFRYGVEMAARDEDVEVFVVNVNNRIKILFGKEYGLLVESEPDEGTRVSIRIPAVPYTEENRKILEKGRIFSRDEMIAREKESYKEKKDEE